MPSEGSGSAGALAQGYVSHAPWFLRIRFLALVIAAGQLLLHGGQFLSSRDPRLLVPHAVAFLSDLLLIFLVSLLIGAGLKLAPLNRGQAAGRLGAGVLVAVGMLLSAYPLILREFLTFPANLFVADMASTRVLLTEYLGIRRFWPVLATGLLGAVALRLPAGFLPRGRWPVWVGLFAGLIALTTVAQTSPHPLIYSLQEQARSFLSAQPRAVASLRQPEKRVGVIGIRGALPDVSLAASPHRKVFVVVLEGVTAADFEREFLNQRNGFYQRVKGQARYFGQYRATNLDSYTSLIAMLTGVVVPYRAYSDEGRYRAVNDSDNLTRIMRQAGYWNLFLSTYEHQPFVPTRADWDRIMDRRDLGALEGWVSLGTSRMEAATEDRAALASLVDQVASKERAFVMHELVYGHSPQWRATTGMTQLEYYDHYLTDLLDRLLAKRLDQESLLVIVSDHGDRAKSSIAENYRVPLLVVGTGVEAGHDDTFLTHLDLPRIIGSTMLKQALPAPRNETWVVGSTERWVYGRIGADGAHLFLDDSTGRVLASTGSEPAASLRTVFQTYMDSFHTRFGP